ncbi:START domain-containing protein [Motiliproteus sp. MSK22-1]|uniref:START domain-containing protein n=1 Tax=Motiliproteus sp. MSK22-1 TaxID=1897630 RepID=UPI000977179E|nr:START domain-containing protein [Motiliproteus sp. MSK22-1]OMH25871.1 hypothetical protein BGP75_25505 [Motiliproteus sp. MSK22-1]
MNTTLMELLVGLLAVLHSSQSLGQEDTVNTEWQKAKDQDGIQVFTREVPGSSIREFKGIIEINSTLDSLSGVLNDIKACPLWVHQCKDPAIIETRGYTERYVYQISDFPFPAQNRDVIHHARVSQNPKTRAITIKLNATPDFCLNNTLATCEPINRSSNIRIRHSQGTYRLEPINNMTTRVIWQQHVEPGGHLPDWMVNSMLVSVPFSTLGKLKEIVQQEKYQTAKLAYNENGVAVGFEIKNW